MRKIRDLARRNLARALVVMLFTAGGMIAVATPAQAQPWPPADAVAGKFNTYKDISGDGGLYYYSPAAYGTCVEVGGSWDNAISSLWNRSGRPVRVYDGHGCSGSNYLFCATESGYCSRSPHLGNIFWNDRISSFKWL